MKKFFADDYFLSEKHAFSMFCLHQQQELDLHTHDFDEIVIITSGSGFHIYNDRPIFISKGDFFYVNYSDSHYFESLNNLVIVNILIRPNSTFHFLNQEIVSFLRNTLSSKLDLDTMSSMDEDTINDVVTLSDQINDHRDESFDFRYFLVTESLLLSIFRILVDSIDGKKNNRRQPYKKALLNYVKDNYMRSLNWGEVETECNINRRTIYRFFNEISGMTPNSFLQQYRIYKVREFLRTTDLTVKEIAYKTGFLYSSHLSRAYSDKFNFPPSHERNLLNKQG